MAATFLASQTRPLWRMIQDYHLDGAALFQRAGLNPALMEQPRARYPVHKVFTVWSEAIKLSGEPHMALKMASYIRVPDFHALAVAFLSSSTLRTGLQRMVRYQKVANTGLQMCLEESGDQLHLMVEPFNLPGIDEAVIEDQRSALLLQLCRMAASDNLNPVGVGFAYPAPRDTSEHYGLFKCPLVFSEPRSRISFALADVDQPLTSANSDLAQAGEQTLRGMLKQVACESLTDQVLVAISEALPSGAPSDTHIARALNISQRTMQRKLADEGARFTLLLNKARQQLAEQYIADLAVPVTEISYLLGFSDVSSFSRAFKRWTGSPPAAYRAKLAA